jgi:hypothetical protein
VTDPVNWMASNPDEHYGLKYDTPDTRPRDGTTFHQREEDAGTCGISVSINGEQVFSETIEGYESGTLTIDSNGEVEEE